MNDVVFWIVASVAYLAVPLPVRGAAIRLVVWNAAILANVLDATVPGRHLETMSIGMQVAIIVYGAARLPSLRRRSDVEGVPR